MTGARRFNHLVPRNPGSTAALALRCAVAAAIAWFVVMPLGGVADAYHYYAPFGAVVVVSTTVMRSLKSSAQVVAALLLGAVIAVIVQAWSPPVLLGIAVAVGVGTLARFPGLGARASWVPVSALFVLLVGQGETTYYVIGYVGLTMLGALVGLMVDLAFPPMMLSPTEVAQDALRDALVIQLRELADALNTDDDRSSAIHNGREELRRRRGEVQDLMADAVGGPSVNWRLHRLRERADLVRRRGDALVGLTAMVGAVTASVAGPFAPSASWGPLVRDSAAHALRATADALEPEGGEEESAFVDAQEAVTWLTNTITAQSPRLEADLFPAAALAEGLRRSIDLLREHIE